MKEKMYNIGDLVKIKAYNIIGAKYGIIKEKDKSYCTGEPMYKVLLSKEKTHITLMHSDINRLGDTYSDNGS
tara:strand:+ start:297 stop:512 length:216 start_codon:yes stop_codon:yes gene_type:complete